MHAATPRDSVCVGDLNIRAMAIEYRAWNLAQSSRDILLVT